MKNSNPTSKQNKKNFKSFTKKNFMQNFLIRTKNEKIDFLFRMFFFEQTHHSPRSHSLPPPPHTHTKMFDFFLFIRSVCVFCILQFFLLCLWKRKFQFWFFGILFFRFFFYLFIHSFCLFHFISFLFAGIICEKRKKKNEKKRRRKFPSNIITVESVFSFSHYFLAYFPSKKRKDFEFWSFFVRIKIDGIAKSLFTIDIILHHSIYNRDSWKFFCDFLGFLIFFDFFW